MIDLTDKEFSASFAVQENQLEFKVKMYSKDNGQLTKTYYVRTKYYSMPIKKHVKIHIIYIF